MFWNNYMIGVKKMNKKEFEETVNAIANLNIKGRYALNVLFTISERYKNAETSKDKKKVLELGLAEYKERIK